MSSPNQPHRGASPSSASESSRKNRKLSRAEFRAQVVQLFEDPAAHHTVTFEEALEHNMIHPSLFDIEGEAEYGTPQHPSGWPFSDDTHPCTAGAEHPASASPAPFIAPGAPAAGFRTRSESSSAAAGGPKRKRRPRNMCKRCLSTFRDKDEALAHQNACPVEHRCEQCCYSTTSASFMQRHLLTHGERKCPLCDKVCISKIALSNHVRTHDSQSQRFACDACGKRYKRKHDLQYHIREKHEGQSQEHYPCPLCDRVLYTQSGLTKHIMCIHPEKRQGEFECEFCGKRFSTPYTVARHVSTVHSI